MAPASDAINNADPPAKPEAAAPPPTPEPGSLPTIEKRPDGSLTPVVSSRVTEIATIRAPQELTFEIPGRQEQVLCGAQYKTKIQPRPIPVGAGWDLTAGMSRYQEFEERDLPGQDAWAIVSDDRYVVAAVADGVSGSFFGNIASFEICRWLCSWLWRRPRQKETAGYLEAIFDYEIAPKVREKVANQQYSPKTPMVLRDVLDELRETVGSEAVFALFIADLELRNAQVFSLGNIAIYYRVKGTHTTNALPRGKDECRWGSVKGLRGHFSRFEVENFDRLVLQTDGFDPTETRIIDLARLNQRDFETLAGKVHNDPGDDDIAFVDLCESRGPSGV